MADFQLETEIINKGFNNIAGIDEAGRGALFGPVVAASVIFSNSVIRRQNWSWLDEIDDSKRLSPKKRKRLARLISASADSVGIGLVSHSEIDKKNIYWASLEAMRRAVLNMPSPPGFLLIDGFNIEYVNFPQKRVPQGDKKSILIASASIIAKVFRDELMNHLDRIFEGYALSKNKGYGTREHYSALQKKGPTFFHRQTFNLGDK